MLLKQRTKHGKKSGRKPVADQVRAMAASGLVEDQIALRLGIDKNELRARYIDAIKRGKATAAASELQIADMRREELHALDAILIAFDGGGWLGPDGRSDLWNGLDGKGARSPADAFAEWLSRGGHFVCAGRNSNFSPERLQKFATVKAAAQKLLKQHANGRPQQRG